MSDPFMAEVRIMSFAFAPSGWAACDGALLPINQNQALFSLLGTRYGGNGQTNFALPDLKGRVPMHTQDNSHFIGERAGEAAHTVSISELPTHVHVAMASNAIGTANSPAGNLLSDPTLNAYAAPGPLTTISPETVAATGGSQPHNNMSPYLDLNFCIALQGVFPAR